MGVEDETDAGRQAAAAGDRQYETKVVQAIRGTESRSEAKWRKEGWELVSQSPGTLRTEMTFRRTKPKTFGTYLAQAYTTFRGLQPKTQQVLASVVGGLVLVLVAVGIFAATRGGDDTPGTAAMPTQAATPSAAPTPPEAASPSSEPEATQAEPETTEDETPEPEPEPVQEASEEEVIAAIEGYLKERADSGVMIAQAVQDVSMSDRVVTVTFDFASTQADAAVLRETNPWENLAEFAGIELIWATEEARYLRTGVDRVDTVEVSGESLGSRTVAELYEMNTGEAYEPGM